MLNALTVKISKNKVRTSEAGPYNRDLGPVTRKMVNFNPGLSQFFSKVFLSTNM